MHIVINGWFVGREDAGSGQYIDHLLEQLSQFAGETRLTLLLPGQERLKWGFDGIEEAYFTLPLLPHNVAKLYWEQVTIPRAAKRMQADVLWIPYWAAPFRQPCPTVVTIHDLIPSLLPEYRGGLLQRAYTALVSATARRSTRVIAVSNASARDIVDHLGIPASRVDAIHHGPNQRTDTSPGLMALEAVCAKYDLPVRYFLYLGGFDVRKNVQGILAAYRAYLDRGGNPIVKLVIAGGLPDEDSAFTPDPLRLAEELDLTENVHFCGWIDEEDKSAIYAMATAYLFPSHYEGFGMMVLEAQSAGTPVVTSQ